MQKNPCGTRDLKEEYLKNREDIVLKLSKTAKNIGANYVETPVMELLSTVKDLYGEEFNKLVYSLDLERSEPLLLRYDLTLPFCRYCASNGIKKGRFYRHGKVYRKDDPQPEKGRYREFYQFDLDIVGENTEYYDLEILDTLLRSLKTVLGEIKFKIKYNFRDLIYSTLKSCGVEDDKFLTVCSSLDKLEKKGWSYIKEELQTKNISEDTFNAIKKQISSDEIPEKIIMFNNKLKILDPEMKYFEYDTTMMRGLDYYSGLVFEVVVLDKNFSSSIAGGGRYDKVIEKLGNFSASCVGFSIGIDRILMLMGQQKILSKGKKPIYVATVGKNVEEYKFKIVYGLRNLTDIPIACSEKTNPKMKQQLDFVLEKEIGYMIVIGSSEKESNKVCVKQILTKKQITIDLGDLFSNINNLDKLF